uniref:Uncharacterized protein n=1 Tax=Ditylenchus dipsaci TaxID=166011 RepID=A0A915CLJ9_9BILA
MPKFENVYKESKKQYKKYETRIKTVSVKDLKNTMTAMSHLGAVCVGSNESMKRVNNIALIEQIVSKEKAIADALQKHFAGHTLAQINDLDENVNHLGNATQLTALENKIKELKKNAESVKEDLLVFKNASSLSPTSKSKDNQIQNDNEKYEQSSESNDEELHSKEFAAVKTFRRSTSLPNLHTRLV